MHIIKRLPGFRSGRPRNMLIGGLFYFWLFVGVIGACTDTIGLTHISKSTPTPAATVALAMTPTATAAPTPKPTATPASAPSPTATPPPTPTPTPTSAPPPPTPTPTPVPPTPTPTRDPASQAYAQSVMRINGQVADSMSELGNLFRDPRPGQSDWTVAVAAQFLGIRAAYNDAQSLTPPDEYATIHVRWFSAMSLLNDATYLLTDGIDRRDPDLINQAIEKIQDANTKIRQATELLTTG